MKKITVFTPTYNRAYCLQQCYDSLLKQTNKDFIWLIIDDGSTDNTKNVVNAWIKENKITIQYHYQENQGMHGGHNSAFKLIETELNVCIDSDDFMPKDAIEHILKFWQNNASTLKQKNIAGFIGLDSYKNGEIIGKQFPESLKQSTLEDLYHKHNIPGDKKIVFLSSVVKKFSPYPIYPDERFVPLGSLYIQMDKEYQFLLLNKVLCIVEYMEDGSSRNILKQYYRHPKGFRYARIITMKYSSYFKVRFKNAIHFVAHSIQLKDYKFLGKSPKPFLTLCAIPFGIGLYFYIKLNNK